MWQAAVWLRLPRWRQGKLDLLLAGCLGEFLDLGGRRGYEQPYPRRQGCRQCREHQHAKKPCRITFSSPAIRRSTPSIRRTILTTLRATALAAPTSTRPKPTSTSMKERTSTSLKGGSLGCEGVSFRGGGGTGTRLPSVSTDQARNPDGTGTTLPSLSIGSASLAGGASPIPLPWSARRGIGGGTTGMIAGGGGMCTTLSAAIWANGSGGGEAAAVGAGSGRRAGGLGRQTKPQPRAGPAIRRKNRQPGSAGPRMIGVKSGSPGEPLGMSGPGLGTRRAGQHRHDACATKLARLGRGEAAAECGHRVADLRQQPPCSGGNLLLGSDVVLLQMIATPLGGLVNPLEVGFIGAHAEELAPAGRPAVHREVNHSQYGSNAIMQLYWGGCGSGTGGHGPSKKSQIGNSKSPTNPNDQIPGKSQ